MQVINDDEERWHAEFEKRREASRREYANQSQEMLQMKEKAHKAFVTRAKAMVDSVEELWNARGLELAVLGNSVDRLKMLVQRRESGGGDENEAEEQEAVGEAMATVSAICGAQRDKFGRPVEGTNEGIFGTSGRVPPSKRRAKRLQEAINGRVESETHGPSPKRRNPSLKFKVKAGALIGTTGTPQMNDVRSIHHLREAEKEREGAGGRARKVGLRERRPRRVGTDEIEEKIRARKADIQPKLANGNFSIVAARDLLKMMRMRAQKENNKEEVNKIEAIESMLRDDFKKAFKSLMDTSN